jgi:hypothetical protein
MTTAEKNYILQWMFKYAANYYPNLAPPNNFGSDDALDAFQGEPTNYKLFNRFQIKYVFNDAGTGFGDDPIKILDAAKVGVTLDPVRHQPDPGHSQQANGLLQVSHNTLDNLTNDASPDSLAVRAFNTLQNPLYWSDIGSTIQFGPSLDPSYSELVQVYPTYYIYERAADAGFYLNKVIPQAALPEENFSATPYYPPVRLGPARFIITP